MQRHPGVLQKWDKWDYTILGPSNMEDSPEVIVILKFKNKTTVALSLPLAGAI